MSTMQINAQVTDQDLLHAVEQMDSKGFQQFVGKVLAIQAKRNVNSLPAEETELLLKINRGLPENLLDRYLPLCKKRDDGNIAPEELRELRRRSDEVERHEADRVAALVELAEVRKITLDQLMTELGIRGPSNGD